MSLVPFKDAWKVDQRYLVFATMGGPWDLATIKIPGDFYVTNSVDDATFRTLVRPKTEREIAEDEMHARDNITMAKVSDAFYWREIREGDLKAVVNHGHHWVYLTAAEWNKTEMER